MKIYKVTVGNTMDGWHVDYTTEKYFMNKNKANEYAEKEKASKYTMWAKVEEKEVIE